VAIPFRDAEEIAALGSAGFLDFVGDGEGNALAGGLLLVDARGEPLELVHHWAALPGGVLWSPEELWRYSARRLAADLFRAVSRTPEILLVRVEEAHSESWIGDLEIEIPVRLIRSARDGQPETGTWLQAAPASPTPAARLYERLSERSMLGEPFDRVSRALREFYPDLL
jgi:hypothetical protein